MKILFSFTFYLISDQCCNNPKTVTGYLGETISISCSYPAGFQKNMKHFFKLGDPSITIEVSSSDSQKGRFSISEDRRYNTVSVKISDVREEDGGVYSCGVWIGVNGISYYTFFQKIQLQVTDFRTIYQSTSAEPTPSSEHSTAGSSVVGITVGVCVVLVLLIGGLTLIFYRLRCTKTQGSASISKKSGTNDSADVVYDDVENGPPGDGNNMRRPPVYQNMKPSTTQYLKIDPRTREADSVYLDLTSNTV
ncbi:uncharacterized protein [Salminus brasiliensis]|uniref:uncharacterized protein isoform X2 n=1 Tax=Salminus brasiliensis TaxID=930266 RepID=UPI003B831E3C